ncbi:hypothetical protein B0H10DRAFT_1414017 [Mycena sp. CBHHK59/15]|nr:hypothetical protein B0H10DRAFT_1414017 [Mycena sp. CBHHK59/15]
MFTAMRRSQAGLRVLFPVPGASAADNLPPLLMTLARMVPPPPPPKVQWIWMRPCQAKVTPLQMKQWRNFCCCAVCR